MRRVGQPLSTLLGIPWELGDFLRVGAGIAKAVGGLHQRGVIHKRLQPSNILVDTVTGEAWLTGFDPSRTTAEAFLYMAPEQSGRMSRSLDARSDLYSLGVTLYEMLTGTLPFHASDPLEWIHCHVARQPVAPVERVPAIPGIVSAMVLKLLAKNAEDRYQTSRGLETDLGSCLSQWESAGRIEQFPLAARDLPDSLLIPERLYGRDREVATLVNAFEKVAREGRQSLVLVSGYSGVGKSSVVNELQRAVVTTRGLFAAGKFEPHERDVPFAPLVRAFRELVRSILLSSDADLLGWEEEIRTALGVNAQLVIDLVPDVERVIGPQPPVADLPPQQAQARFYRVLQRFVSVFARREHPLALFIDDLQWVDRATLDFLRMLATHDEDMPLLLVGAYRENEVGPTHPLRETLVTLRRVAVVQEVALAQLLRDDLRALVCDALHDTPERVEPLVEAVFEQTAGNPFFVIQFLRELSGEGFLAFDPVQALWIWDVARIRAKGYTENVVDLLAGKLDRLPPGTQAALRALACVSVGRLDVLRTVLDCSEDELDAVLSPAVDTGLVRRVDDGYAFRHDRIREAAYALVPEPDRPAAHLRIGRLLLARIGVSDTSEFIFDVVTQLNRGASLVGEPEERLQLAELNLIAGRRARATAAFQSALAYLVAGEELLSEDQWQDRYDLRFALALNRAECEFLTGELAAADERLSRLMERARGRPDLAAVTCLRIAIYTYTTMDRTDLAIEVGLKQLQAFGIEWPAHPSDGEVREEYELLRRRLGNRPIEALVDLPLATDADVLALTEILLGILPAASITDRKLHDLAALRLANVSLQHGNCDGSTMAFAQLSMVIGPRFGHHRDGFRFGELGLALVDRKSLTRFRARVYVVVGSNVLPWTRPIPAAISLLRRGLDLAQETGDLMFAAFSQAHVISLRLALGDPLEDVVSEAERYLQSCRRTGFGLVGDCILGQLSVIRSLRGTPAIDLELGNLERRVQDSPRLDFASNWYWIRRMQTSIHAGDYPAALQAGANVEQWEWVDSTFLECAEYHFYSAMAHAGAADSSLDGEAARHREALESHRAQLARWAADCADTFASRAALAAAEAARLDHRILEAEQLYEEAIRAAHATGALHIEGLASELAARFYRGRGLEHSARAFHGNALACYGRWGADTVVRRLQSEMPSWPPAQPSHPPDTSAGTVEGLDLAAVINVSQAVAGEIEIDKLVEAVMISAVQHAGAERGLLIVRRGEDARIEAEALTTASTIRVSFRRAPVEPSDLPEGMLRFVLRTGEPMIVDDASAPHPFAGDRYLAANGVRSVMCLPLVKQARLVGALYLENRLASHAFTPSRIALLKVLASQAAISLENAYLYSDLREAQAYLAEAQRLSSTGSFGWRPASGELVWSAETYRIFQLDPATKPSVDIVLAYTHPEDRRRLQQFIERTMAETRDWEIEHRLLMSDGSVKHLRVVARAARDESSGRTEYIGSVMDVTATVEARHALEKGNSEIQAALGARLEAEFYLAEGQRLAHTGSWAFTAAGFKHWSPELFAIHGLVPGGRAPSIPEYMALVHPDDREFVAHKIQRMLADHRGFDFTKRIVRPDGTLRYVRCVGVPEPNGEGFVGTGIDVTEQEQLTAALRKSEIELRQANIEVQAALRARFEAALAERTRIAQELHDTLLQGFAGVALQLKAAELALPDQPDVAAETLTRVHRLATEALREARESVWDLRGTELDELDLIEALRRRALAATASSNIVVAVSARGAPRRLPRSIEAAALRVGREAVANAVKHAEASRIHIDVEFDAALLVLRIRDDGRGFTQDQLETAIRSGHLGITSMQDRARQAGGTCEVGPGVQGGTVVSLRLPLGEEGQN